MPDSAPRKKNAEQPPETPANPPGAPPRKHAPHTAGKQNAGAPGGAPQQNPATFTKESTEEKRARAGNRTRTHTTSQTSTHNSVAANARPRTQRGHDSTPPTSGRSHYFKLHEQATTSIQLYQVPPVGLEPTTYSLRVHGSNQLSYRGFIFARSRRDSNPQPPATEAGALSIELRKQNTVFNYIVPPAGVEPATCRASTGRSYQTELQRRNVRAHQDKGGRQARTQFWRRDSNPRHWDYETHALPTELRQDTRSK